MNAMGRSLVQYNQLLFELGSVFLNILLIASIHLCSQDAAIEQAAITQKVFVRLQKVFDLLFRMVLTYKLLHYWLLLGANLKILNHLISKISIEFRFVLALRTLDLLLFQPDVLLRLVAQLHSLFNPAVMADCVAARQRDWVLDLVINM